MLSKYWQMPFEKHEFLYELVLNMIYLLEMFTFILGNSFDVSNIEGFLCRIFWEIFMKFASGNSEFIVYWWNLVRKQIYWFLDKYYIFCLSAWILHVCYSQADLWKVVLLSNYLVRNTFGLFVDNMLIFWIFQFFYRCLVGKKSNYKFNKKIFLNNILFTTETKEIIKLK